MFLKNFTLSFNADVLSFNAFRLKMLEDGMHTFRRLNALLACYRQDIRRPADALTSKGQLSSRLRGDSFFTAFIPAFIVSGNNSRTTRTSAKLP